MKPMFHVGRPISCFGLKEDEEDILHIAFQKINREVHYHTVSFITDSHHKQVASVHFSSSDFVKKGMVLISGEHRLSLRVKMI